MATKTPLAEYAGTFRVMASGDTIPAAIVPTLNQNTTGSAATLTTARTINGTSFNGSANITTASWGTSRTITIGSTGKAVNGSANVTWTLSEIGAPSTTGVGASGTWGISITGNAATASNATNATYLPPMARYSKGETDLTTSYPSGLSSVFVQPANGWASYGTVTTAKGLSAGGGTLQLYAPYSEALGGKALRVRFGDYSNAGGAGWTGWKTVLQDDNFNDYAPTLTGTGASGTWGISITGSAATLTTARTLTIGSTGKTFNGSANVSWSLAEIGAIADAPSDGTTYGRKDGAWVATGAGGGGGITWSVSGSASTLAADTAQIVTAAVNKTLPATTSAGQQFVVHAKVDGVRIVSNGNVITGVGSGNDLTLLAGETAHLVVSSSGNLEIV